jgi:2-oxo-4-hydroxy-4-carboxy-5-ureidoimidazoline decarboxylase
VRRSLTVFEMRVDEFNALPADDARALVAGWLGVRRWVDEVVAGRPYSDTDELRRQAHDSALDLTDHELASALSRHPRIGERPSSNGAEARHSRSEQAGVKAADAERLRAANLTYEQRFGHVFLVRASGRSAEALVTALRQRLGNDPDTEWGVVAEELREITRLRLERLLQP